MAINYGYFTLPYLSNYLSYINGTSLYGPFGFEKETSTSKPIYTDSDSTTSDTAGMSTYPVYTMYGNSSMGQATSSSIGNSTSSLGTPSSNSVIGQAVAEQGLAGLQGMATNAATMGALGYGFGMSPSQAVGFGLSQGFSPASIGSVVGGMASTSMGLNQASPTTTGLVSSIIGGIIGGPLGGLLGGFVGPAVSTLAADAMDARDNEQTLDTMETMAPTAIGGYRSSQAFGMTPDPTMSVTSVPAWGMPDVVSQMTQAMAPNMSEEALGKAQDALQSVLGAPTSRSAVNATLGPSVQGLLGAMMSWGPEMSTPAEIADLSIDTMMADLSTLDQSIADLGFDLGMANTVSADPGLSEQGLAASVASEVAGLAAAGFGAAVGAPTSIGGVTADSTAAANAAAVAGVADATAGAAVGQEGPSGQTGQQGDTGDTGDASNGDNGDSSSSDGSTGSEGSGDGGGAADGGMSDGTGDAGTGDGTGEGDGSGDGSGGEGDGSGDGDGGDSGF